MIFICIQLSIGMMEGSQIKTWFEGMGTSDGQFVFCHAAESGDAARMAIQYRE